MENKSDVRNMLHDALILFAITLIAGLVLGFVYEVTKEPRRLQQEKAIAEACKTLGGWRLWQCTMYVTLEPCPMCAGAIINARIPRVVFGASDQKCGACGSVCDLFAMDFNHRPQVEKGLREEECGALLTEFFKTLRMELRTRPKWRKKPE